MIILVCGSRKETDWAFVFDTLDREASGASLIVHGNATGVDTFAKEWAKARGIPETGEQYAVTKADWDRLGRAAGPVRNEAMMRKENPEKVIAFPGGTGTASMRRIAKAYGVEPLDIERRK